MATRRKHGARSKKPRVSEQFRCRDRDYDTCHFAPQGEARQRVCTHPHCDRTMTL